MDGGLAHDERRDQVALYLTTLETLSGHSWFDWCRGKLQDSVTDSDAKTKSEKTKQLHSHWGYATQPQDVGERLPINWQNWVSGVYSGYERKLTDWQHGAPLLVPLANLERKDPFTRPGNNLADWNYDNIHIQRSPSLCWNRCCYTRHRLARERSLGPGCTLKRVTLLVFSFFFLLSSLLSCSNVDTDDIKRKNKHKQPHASYPPRVQILSRRMPECSVCAAITPHEVCSHCVTSCQACGQERCLICNVDQSLEWSLGLLCADPRILTRFAMLSSLERHYQLPWMQRARISRAAHWLWTYYIRCYRRDLAGQREADDRNEAILQSLVRHLRPRGPLLTLVVGAVAAQGSLPAELVRSILAFVYDFSS